MLELTGWSEDVMPQSSLHSTEGLMCHNHRAGLVVTAPRLPALLAAPALPACGIFLEQIPPKQKKRILKGGGESTGSGVLTRLGHRRFWPYREVNQDINQYYRDWDRVRYLWFEACWQGSALPKS